MASIRIADSTPAATSENAASRTLALLSAPKSLARDVALADALDAMTATDFAAHAAELEERIKQLSWNDPLAASVMDSWFRIDPASARDGAARVVHDARSQDRYSKIQVLCGAFAAAAARHDPQWAVDHLLSDPSAPAQRWSADSEILREIVGKDRKLAERCLQSYQTSPSRPAVLKGYVEGISNSEPLKALDLALSEHTSLRGELISVAVSAAARAGEGMARTAVSRIEDPLARRIAALRAADKLLEESVNVPFDLLLEEGGLRHPPSSEDGSWEYADSALSTMVERDPAAAANWAMSLPGESRDVVLPKVLKAWNSGDESGFLEWAAQSGVRSDRKGGAGGEETSERFATELVQMVSANSLLQQGKVLEALQVAPKPSDPSSAARLEYFVSNAASEAPDVAAEWVLGLAASGRCDTLVTAVAENFAKSRPQEAAAWVEGIPQGASRDAALVGLANTYALADPRVAADWITQIHDLKVQQKAAMELYWWHYQYEDQTAAREWLRTLPGVSERLKSKWGK